MSKMIHMKFVSDPLTFKKIMENRKCKIGCTKFTSRGKGAGDPWVKKSVSRKTTKLA